MAGVAEIRIAMGMKNACPDQVAESRTDEDVGREVVAAGKPGCGNRQRGPISQELYPSLRIFVGDHAGHRPGKHGMSGREGSVEVSMAPEAAVSGSFVRAFPSCKELHRRVDQKGIR